MFLLSLDGDLGLPLEWQQGSQDSSGVEVGKSCFLKLQEGSWASSRVAAETWGSSLVVVAGNSGLAGECHST